jgi:uncharacterized protein YukE
MRTIDISGGYQQAQEVLLGANHDAAEGFGSLTDRLDDFGGMAGDDSWAGDWARSYDGSAAQAVEGYQQLVAALGNLHRLTRASLENHRRADRASVISRPSAVYAGDGESVSVDRAVSVGLPTLLSSLGGDGGGPDWWGAVTDKVEGLFWPDADCPKLDAAAEVWDQAAAEVRQLGYSVGGAKSALAEQRSPEVPLALATLADLGDAITTLSDSMAQIAVSCRDHAREVEKHRDEIMHVGVELGVESALIQLGSGLLAIPTVSVSEWVGQSVQGARLIAAGVRIRTILGSLTAGVALRVALLARAGETAVREVPMLRKIAKARVIHASAKTEAAQQAVEHGLVHVGRGRWRSSAGLIYVPTSSEYGARLEHVLLHAYPSGWKRKHTLFKDKERILETLDEAWLRRDFPVKGQPGVFEVEMGRIIGDGGETVVRLVVERGTNEVVSAYPILHRQAVAIPPG